MSTPNPVASAIKMATATLAVAAVVLTTLLTVTLTEDREQPQPASTSTGMVLDAQGAPTSPDDLVPETQGNLRDYVTAEHRDDFDAYMADPRARTRFLGALQAGFDQHTKTTNPNTDATTGGSVQNVLAYGFSRDHVWVTASYADMARGAIWGAVAWCKRYAPAWACQAAGNWLTSIARGWGSANNHGVWAAIYWNRVTGGRW